MLKDIIKTYRDNPGFRPLIRGFFFYKMKVRMYRNYDKFVSVPSFGDSFFIQENYAELCSRIDEVSVPSFGDSFFIA